MTARPDRPDGEQVASLLGRADAIGQAATIQALYAAAAGGQTEMVGRG